MRNLANLLALMLVTINCFSQTFTIEVDGISKVITQNGPITGYDSQPNSFKIKVDNPPAGINYTLNFKGVSASLNNGNANNSSAISVGNFSLLQIPQGTDIRNDNFQIMNGNTQVFTFKLVQGNNTGGNNTGGNNTGGNNTGGNNTGGNNTGGNNIGGNNILPSLEEIFKQYNGYEITEFGIVINSGSNIPTNPNYIGKNYYHLFFDELGNSLFSTIPQGVANKQYIVHIWYRQIPSKAIVYSVNQTKGGFNNALFFNNKGAFDRRGSNQDDNNTIKYASWENVEFPLRPSNDEDIEFQINGSNLDTKEKNTFATYSIKIDKIIHGNFDVGLLSTQLANPTFELVDGANGSKVVKKSNDGNYGIVTAMFTFYASPFRILRKLLFDKNKEIENQTLYGKSYYDDHRIIERIYPSVGVSLSQNTFKNLFLGINWEIARGGSFFAGYHYGQVNTFTPDLATSNTFEFGVTPITQTQFNLYTNSEWKWSPAFGVKLDISIIREFFGGLPK